METASQDLMNEHKAVLIMLGVIEKICEILKASQEADLQDIADIFDFLRIFVDKCHHGKEEGFLFPALEQAGIPNQNGPIGVMLAEHKMGRELVKQMLYSVTKNTIKKDEFIASAYSYVRLLRNHIEKENSVLFPMGDSRLSEPKQKELLNAFERLEDEVIGKGKHEEFHTLLKHLENKYLKPLNEKKTE
jgi:hemerythrin-like domain-containing protein